VDFDATALTGASYMTEEAKILPEHEPSTRRLHGSKLPGNDPLGKFMRKP
jgi:hypothetical protein